jgi:tetratricopeptide (TPR) repeat protein
MLAEANLFRTRGQFEEAVSACMRILQRDASHAAAHSLIADIYRDQGNYREALNWFKLAVELNPDNEADKRKLDEMIDRVFQGVLAGEMRSSVKAIAQPTASSSGKPAPARRAPGVKAFLAGIQPVYVAVGFAILITAIFAFISMQVMAKKIRTEQNTGRNQVTNTASKPDGPSSNTGANTSATAVNVAPTAPPQVSPPPPDAVENGATQPQTVAGLPGIIVNPNPGNLASPPRPAAGDTPTSNNPPVPENNTGSATTSQVPPLSPLTDDDSIASRIDLLILLMKHAMKSSKLDGTLNEVTIDPHTNMLRVNYTVPRMRTATETKQGLLYIGLHLIWSVPEQSSNIISGYTLLGYAYSDTEHPPSLALAANVALEQASASRTAADYKTVLQYLTRTWWRADLAAAAL